MKFIIIGLLGLIYTYFAKKEVENIKVTLEKEGKNLYEIAKSSGGKIAQEWVDIEKGTEIFLYISITFIIVGIIIQSYKKIKKS